MRIQWMLIFLLPLFFDVISSQPVTLYNELNVTGPDVAFDIPTVFETAHREGQMIKLELHYSIPVHYTLSICGIQYLGSIEPVSDEVLVFGEKWTSLNWTETMRKCDMFTRKRYISISADVNATGQITFTTIDQMSTATSRTAASEFNVTQPPKTTKRYKTSFKTDAGNHRYFLRTDLISPAEVEFGKCNLKLVGKPGDEGIFMNEHTVGRMELHPKILEGIELLKDVHCAEDRTQFFDTIVMTKAHGTTGTIAYAMTTFWGIEIFALSIGVPIVILCIICVVEMHKKARKNAPNEPGNNEPLLPPSSCTSSSGNVAETTV